MQSLVLQDHASRRNSQIFSTKPPQIFDDSIFWKTTPHSVQKWKCMFLRGWMNRKKPTIIWSLAGKCSWLRCNSSSLTSLYARTGRYQYWILNIQHSILKFNTVKYVENWSATLGPGLDFEFGTFVTCLCCIRLLNLKIELKMRGKLLAF